MRHVPNQFAQNIDRDVISSIVKKYLEPTFQCDVSLVRSSDGNEHPIVTVPAHGAAPVCAKANGPMDSKKIQGIIQGQHYLRKPGAESAAIVTAAEWAPVIRRCAMHERASILGALDAALRGAQDVQPSAQGTLKQWHESARREFLQEVGRHKGCERLSMPCMCVRWMARRAINLRQCRTTSTANALNMEAMVHEQTFQTTVPPACNSTSKLPDL